MHQERLVGTVARTRGKRNKTHMLAGQPASDMADEGPGNREGTMEEEYVHVVVQDEELFPAVLHDVLAEVVDEIRDGDGLGVLVVGGDDELVMPLVREEHLEAAPEEKSAHGF